MVRLAPLQTASTQHSAVSTVAIRPYDWWRSGIESTISPDASERRMPAGAFLFAN